MSEDISKNTVMVLVVLTIVISLLGTWTVINEAGRFHMTSGGQMADTDSTTTTGLASVTITEASEPVIATGQVTIEIV